MSTVILVTGPPASGKTTLARTVARRLALPVLAKDTIKESLYDALPDDRRSSKHLGHASYQVLLALAGELIHSNVSFVLENAFRTADEEALRRLLAGTDVLHVHCHADWDTLGTRLHQRMVAGERHASHQHADIPATIALDAYTPRLGHDALVVPTDDFESERYRAAVTGVLERARDFAGLQRPCR